MYLLIKNTQPVIFQINKFIYKINAFIIKIKLKKY